MIDRDIEARMDAYRGNPQALAQKYAVGQELLDLIALQKLKSEKEAAMRNMQLQMAQQGKPPTIAQRREAEVLGMTKDEILQQQGGIMKQKQQAQQQALEELAAQRNPAAGIPTLPTPDVMPEAAMAAGGIVAFAGGGTPPDWKEENRRYAKGQQKREEDRFSILAEELRREEQALRTAKAAEDKQRIQNNIDALRREMRAIKPAPSASLDSGIAAIIPTAQAREPSYIRDPMQERGVISPTQPATPPVVAIPPAIAGPKTPTPPAPPTSIPYPIPGVPNEERKSIPYPEGVKDLVPRGASPGGAPAAPAAPAAPKAAGLEAILPPEYQGLAKKQVGALESQLGTDAEELARQRAIEYYQQYGVPVEKEADLARARLEDRLKRQAEIRQAEKGRRLTEALLGAQGATWQEALGSSGRAGLASIRRGEAEELKQLEAEDVARRGLADIGLGVKKGVLEARGAGRKEGIEALQKGVTEAGLAVGRAMTAETQRDITAAQLEANRIMKETALAQQRTQDEAQRQTRVESGRNAALRALKPLYDRYKSYADQQALGVKMTPEQQREMQALEKQIQLEQDRINARFDSMLSGGSGAVGGSGFTVEKIK